MLAVFAVACVVFSAPPLLRAFLSPERHNKDYDLWLETGRKVLADQPLYEHAVGEGLRYMYPPFAAVVFMAPLAWFGPWVLVPAIVLCNVAAWAACVVLSARAARGANQGVRASHVVVPFVVTAPYVWDNFLLGQPNVVLLAMMLAGFAALRARRDGIAGALFACAAAVKAFPILILVYLLVRRRWRASGWFILSLPALLFAAPGIVRGFARNAAELAAWAAGMLSPSGERLGAGGAAMNWGNQSIFGLAHRLLRPLPLRPSLGGEPFTVNVADLSPAHVQMGVAVLGIAAGAVFMLRMPSRRACSRRSEGIEAAVVLAFMAIFAPVSRTYMFCWLMPAVAVCAELARPRALAGGARARFVLAGWLGVMLLALAATQAFTAGPQAFGTTTLGASVLTGMLLWALGRSELAYDRPSDLAAREIAAQR